MPELSTAPADSAITGLEKLLTLDFENVTVQQVADANESKSADIASAATTDLSTVATPYVHVTGTTTITGFGSVAAGAQRILVFDAALLLTYNATSLILPTSANITTAAGDAAVFRSEGSGNWRCVAYQRADGTALATGGGGGASIGVQYTADTGSTADSDPGAGLMKWNNATQASATVLFLDDDTSDGVSLTGWWSALDSGGFCYLQHATDQDTWQIWEIGTITDATGYVKLAVTLLANGGSFADGDPMLITLEQGSTGGAVSSVNGDTGAVIVQQPICIACSDETTALTTGVAKVTFRMPYAFTLTAVRASVTTAPTGAVLTVDINEGGATILSTKLTIDATEKTSTTAATPPVISDSSLADDAEITIDIDTVGSTIAGAGLKVWLIGSAT